MHLKQAYDAIHEQICVTQTEVKHFFSEFQNADVFLFSIIVNICLNHFLPTNAEK